ncbi:MAG TPA: RHS repeat-associated core domain-containing protein [Pyrinomonadaceae bacterium]
MTRTDLLTLSLTPTTVMRGGASLRLKRLAARLALVCLLCLAASAAALGQNIQFTQGANGTGAENTIQIPLTSYPGRGGTSLPVTLYYSSRVWRLSHLATVNDSSYYTSITEAIYAEHSTAGWKTTLDLPEVEWPKEDDQYYYTGKQFCFICGSNFRRFRVARVYIRMPDGTSHELRQSDLPYEGPLRVFGTFYAVDGSRLRYDSTGATTGTLYMPDGSRYGLNGSSALYVDRSGNVTNYSYTTGKWTDTFGRQVGQPFPKNPQPQTYEYVPPGFQNDHPFKFVFKHLSDPGVLTVHPGQTQPPARKPIANNYLPNPSAAPTNFAGNNYPQWVQSSWSPNDRPSLFITDQADEEAPNTYVVGRGQVGGALFDPVVMTEVVLPNGLSYKFTYNVYGEIDKIVYPPGGYQRFEYAEMAPTGELKPPYSQANRSLKVRELSAKGDGTDANTWRYEVTPSSVTTTAPDGSYTLSRKYDFPAPAQSGTRSTPHFWPFGFVDARQGLVYEERAYDKPPSEGGVMLRRSLTDFAWTTNNIPPRIGLPGEETEQAYRNARPTKQVNIILDTGLTEALVKKATFQYQAADPFDAWNIEMTVGLDRTGVTETHYVPVGQSVAATGTVATIADGYTYPVASTLETVYLNDGDYRLRHLLALETSVTMRDAAGTPVSKRETFYDERDLVLYGDLVGDPNYADPGSSPGLAAPRGHPTTVRRYINPAASVAPGVACPAGVCLESRAQFDQCGNPVYNWDEAATLPLTAQNANMTKVYSADYKHALPTTISTLAPDPTGDHGSTEPLTSTNTYDPVTGHMLATTDVNGRVTSFSYDIDATHPDPLNRLRRVDRPNGGYTLYDYHDAEKYVRTETRLDAARSTNVYQFIDGLGRASHSLSAEGGGNYIAADTLYDTMGRAWKTSNPYRTQSFDGVVAGTLWTTTEFDKLGRANKITHPDGTSVTTAYERGVYVTVTSQAGKQTRRKADGLGRIVRVDEPGASGTLGDFDSPAQPSFIEYDLLGNVVSIHQGLTQAGANPETAANYAQHRYFKYDALSRMTYEKQAEQAATIADPVTGQPTWSRRLAYDETLGGVSYKGYLTTTEDARHVLTHYRYDGIGRTYQVSYTDGTTPTITNRYDQPRTDAPPDGETAVVFYNKGRLTEVSTAAAGSIPQTQQLYDYDQMGQARRQQQWVGANVYTMRYDYNIGGAITSERYPTGRVVSMNYDDAGRLLGVGAGATNYASAISYKPHGGLESMTLGNGAVFSMSYSDTRLQVSGISLMQGAATIQRYEYKYGRVDMANGSVDETKDDGLIARIEGYIGAERQWQQRFDYDPLGRLKAGAEYHGASLQSRSYLLNYDYDVYGNRYQQATRNQGNNVPQSWVELGDFNAANNRFTAGMTYDDAGNVTADARFRLLKFQYDANNRLKRSSTLADANAVDSVYDGAGQRLASMSENNVTRVFVYDAFGELVAEYGQTAAPPPGGTQYVMADQQGTPRVVMRAAPVGGDLVLARRDYLPFGEDAPSGLGPRTPAQGYAADDHMRHKYAGMERDDATGMSHTLWREYDNRSARWTAPDPYGGSLVVTNPQSFNRYNYVNNDPVNQTDPSGLMPGADQGWSTAGNGFWGGGVDFSTPMFGQNIVAEAMGRHDAWVAKDMEEGGEYGPDEEEEEAEQEGGGTEGTTTDGEGGQQAAQPAEEKKDDRPNITEMVDPNDGVYVQSNGQYRFKIGTTSAHDGDHVLGAREGSTIKGAKGLTGTILTWYIQEPGKPPNYSVYILLPDKKTVMVLKDIENLSAKVRSAPQSSPGDVKSMKFLNKDGSPKSKVTLKVGDKIGTTAKWSGPVNIYQRGLHFGFVKYQFIEQYRKDISRSRPSPENYYINPCGASSPVRCK